MTPWSCQVVTNEKEEQIIPGFTPEAKWNKVSADTIPITKPSNKSTSKLVGPTVPTGEDDFKKFNFSETFGHPPFIAMS